MGVNMHVSLIPSLHSTAAAKVQFLLCASIGSQNRIVIAAYYLGNTELSQIDL